MKYYIYLVGLFVSLCSWAETADLFQKPLIIGASVSANYNTTGPGTRAALRYTAEENIKSTAISGALGADQVRLVTPELLADRSVVIALDFLFWDSMEPLNSGGVDALVELVTKTKKAGVPLILGDIPKVHMVREKQIHEQSLNDQIRYVCTPKNNCYLFPLASYVAKIYNGIVINGRFYSGNQLTARDGVHLNDLSAEYLADELIELVESL